MKNFFLHESLLSVVFLFILFPVFTEAQTKLEEEATNRENQYQKNIQADFCHTMDLPENRPGRNIIDQLNRLNRTNRSGSRSSNGNWDLRAGYGSSCVNDCDLTTSDRTTMTCNGTQSGVFQIPLVYTVSTTTGCTYDHDDDASTPEIATGTTPTTAELSSMVDIMNDFFACQGIPMNYYLCGENASAPNGFREGTFGCVYDQTSITDIPNVVNIYVYPNTGNGGGCNGFAPLPFSTNSDIDIAMSHACYNGFVYTKNSMDCSNIGSLGSGQVLIHELGHYFGLYHTHETDIGINSSVDCDDPTTATDDCSKGDAIQDTDEDPDFSGGELGCTGCNTGGPSGDCAFNNSSSAACMPYGTPNTINNIMSYNLFQGCVKEFTVCQKAKMIDALTCVRGLQMCCRDVDVEFAGGVGDTQKEICINGTIPTFTAASDCYIWYDGLGSTANQIGTGATFTPTGIQVDVTCPGVTTFYLGDLNELNPECRTPVTVTVLASPGDGSTTSTTSITDCSGPQNIILDTDANKLDKNQVVGWWVTGSPLSFANQAALNTALAGATVGIPITTDPPNNIIVSNGGSPKNDLTVAIDCGNLTNGGTYYMTPVLSNDNVPAPTSFTASIAGQDNVSPTTNNLLIPVCQVPISATLEQVCITLDYSCRNFATMNDIDISLQGPNGTTIVLESFFLPNPSTPTTIDFCFVDNGTGYTGASSTGCNASCFTGNLESDNSFSVFDGVDPNGTWTIKINDDNNPAFYPCNIDVEVKFDMASEALTFPTVTHTDCYIGAPVAVTCNCNTCPTLAVPTALSVTQESACAANCTPAGGAWALATSPCPAGSSLQSFPNATATTGGIAMTTAPTYNQTMAETFNVRCVCDTDATTVSDVQTVSSVPGTCTPPVAPTLTITDNSCPTTTGSIGATGAGGTLHYFTGTSLPDAMSNAMLNTGPSTVVPTYAAFPTVVHICVVETDANGCRSSSTCKSTAPVNCTIPCPIFATPTALSITSESACAASCTPAGGVWALTTSPCPTGSSLQSFTSATAVTGGIAMTTAPTYNQTTAETFNVRCVCDTDATTVSDVQTVSSVPGTCTPPVAPTLTITNNSCPMTTGSIVAGGAGGTLHYFTGTNLADAMSNAMLNIGPNTVVPTYAAFPTVVHICVVETDANGCRSSSTCKSTAPVSCTIPCPIFATPTALSITSESACAANCAPAGGAWALAISPCPTGSSLQSFTSAAVVTGGIAMTTAPTYNQTTAETFHVRCVCGSDATNYSNVQTITSTPGACTNPATPTLIITNNTCPAPTGTIAASGGSGTFNYFTGADAATAMGNATNNVGGTTTAPAYAVFPTTLNICVIETDANGCRSLPVCGITAPVDCSCIITSANPNNIQCNDNNTPNDPLDDFITFSINPTGNNLGSNYSIAGATPSSANYGAATSFSMAPGSAGTGDLDLTIIDGTDATCSFSTIVTDPGVCSNFVFTGNNTGGTAFMAKDPCTCNGDQVLNSNGSVAVAGTFSETVTVNGPPNLNVRIKTISASTGSDPSLTASVLIETPANSGTYVVTFNHIDRIGYNISEFEFSTAANPGNFMVVMDDDGLAVNVSNRCAYPRIVCSPALASSMDITDAPINLSLTELSTDVAFLGGVSTFTINGTTTSVFDPANSPAIVGNNTIVATYDFNSGSGQGGLAGAPAIPIDADNDPSNGVCPISLPAKTVNVIGEEQSIPTMSQWGLIIFGLLILNMLIVLLYRKEQLLLE